MTDLESTDNTPPYDGDAQGKNQDDAGNGLQFLPVNQIVSAAEATRQRAYLSCDACRQRKTRCVPASPGRRHPCQRCVADDKACQFRSSRAVGARRSHRGRLLRNGSTALPSAGHAPATSPLVMVDTSSGQPPANTEREDDDMAAPEDSGLSLDFHPPFEPRGEGILSQFDTTDNIDAGRSASTVSPNVANGLAQPTARSRIIATQLHDTADALDLLTLAAAGVQNDGSHPDTQDDVLDQAHATSLPSAHASAEAWPQPTADSDWKKFILIRKGVLTKLEVVEYLQFYFNVIWPLRPIVHPFYCDKARYALLAVEEPLLLTCLITLASRYHVLSGVHGEIRSERIHWQAWRFLQKYLQSALWGSPVTRTLGAIVAMLLMIEWHAKSINNPLGLSDGDDYELFNIPESEHCSPEKDPSTLQSSTNRQRFGMTTLLEKLNIVAPAYRSNKMSWMLLSNAIALAQESGCFERDPRESQTSFSRYETFKYEWNQLICVFIYLADESLSMRLGLETLSPGKSIDAVRSRFSSSFASLLPESILWESYYELTLVSRKARELLQSLKKAGSAVVISSILPELEHIERGLSRWKRQHLYTTSIEASLLRACIDLEYQYLVMYSFAPASHVMLNDNSGESPDRPALKPKSEALLMLAERATSASREMLDTLVNVLEPSKMLKYVPVRCWQFVVAANLHLLKTTLTTETATVDPNGDLALLRASIIAIRNGSPDDTHMAVRYARFLEIMLNSSYHLSRAETPNGQGEEPSSFARDDSGQVNMGGHGNVSPYITLNEYELPDIVNGLGNIGELVDWSDGPFGTFGVMGFLPNA